MTNLCGWFDRSSNIDSAQKTAEQMLNSQGALNSTPSIINPDRALLAKGGAQLDCISTNGLEVAVLGNIRWNSIAHKNPSTNKGAARILADIYAQKGERLFDTIGGHFSFVLLDVRNKKAILAVDRIGVQSMYFSIQDNTGLVFGTDCNSIRAYNQFSYPINQQSIFDYLFFHVIPSPHSIYSDIKKIEPAHALIYQEGEIRHECYWKPSFTKSNKKTIEQLSENLLTTLEASVANSIDDNNTGAFLSGGLDSSTVVGMLSKVTDRKPSVFSIGFSVPGYDEMEFARIAANHFNCKLHEYYVTPEDIVDTISVVTKTYDEPFGNSSAIPTMFCAKLAKGHGVDVLLAGDGGDELFAGNERYAKQKVFQHYSKLPSSIQNTFAPAISSYLANKTNIKFFQKLDSYVAQASMPMPDRMQSYNFLVRSNLNNLFHPDFLAEVNPQHPFEIMSSTYNRVEIESIIDNMLYLDWQLTLADNDIRKVNKMCEVQGISVKYPMLDDSLIEFSTTIPASLKLHKGKLRYFYKNAVQNFLPNKIINKSKHGFGLPFGEWLKQSNNLQDIIYSSLEAIKSRYIMNPNYIDELISTHKTGHAAYYGSIIWALVILEMWLSERNL